MTTGRDRLRRGEVWVANLNPNRGQEMGKVRPVLGPVLIVQGDWLTEAQARTVVVLPMTSEVRPEVHPLRVTVGARGRLRTDSQVVVEQPRTVDRDRIGDGPLTELTAAEMMQVEESLLAVLGVFRD
ncbi:MAG: type II toxin-antitoxin system PemK/MazF family toxin [Gammaproteobacteria bacterium]|nr:type II toxin-antitoxin system PemK/MazF family toxin [Gammaproteobacteria bacterium]